MSEMSERVRPALLYETPGGESPQHLSTAVLCTLVIASLEGKLGQKL